MVPDKKIMIKHSSRIPLRKKHQRTKGKKVFRATGKDLKSEIQQAYSHLLKRIQKIRLLEDSVFPVSELQEFWDKESWRRIISKKAKAHRITLELLSNRYDLGIDRLSQMIFDSKRHGKMC